MAIGMLILGMVAGIFSVVTCNRLLRRAPSGWIVRWLRPRGGSVTPQHLIRLRRTMMTRWDRSLLVPFSTMIAGAAFCLVYESITWFTTGEPSYWISLGFLAAVVGGYPFALHQQLAEYRSKVTTLAALQTVRAAKPEDSGPLLIEGSNHRDPVVRLAAVSGLRELGTNSGVEALKRLGEDGDRRVAAAARNALSDLLPALRGTLILSVRTMDTYVEEHRFLETQLGSNKPGVAAAAFDKLHEISKQIDEIVYSQLSLRRAFPDLYCADCYSRAEAQRYADWEWVRCKQCHEIHGLKVGVEKVIGQIGGDADWALEGGVLRLNLWDEKAHKARYAEMDVFEVVGGKALNYDWAVSAVIDKLHNQQQGPANRIAVKLSAEPTLEVNTLQLLRTLDVGTVG